MIIGKSIYQGDEFRIYDKLSDNPEYDGERTQALTEIQSNIQSWYRSGARIFEREAIEGLMKQLRALDGEAGTVSIRGLDGREVEFVVETGSTIPIGPKHEYIVESPFIYYFTFQSLTTITDMSVPRIAYCSLRIYHYVSLRDKLTHEIINEVPEKLVDVDECEAHFMAVMKSLEASHQLKLLHAIVKAANASAPIRQIVAFACGNISWDLMEGQVRSASQHALILSLQRLLGNQVQCFAQDPEYTEADMAVLVKHGITILNNPEAFLKVDTSTLVISCSAEVPVKQVTLELTRPAIMFWDRMKEADPKYLWADADSPRTLELLQSSYDEYDCVADQERFGQAVLYVKRATAEKDVDIQRS
ncbi:hypothetical protein EJ05DRAFT_503835 [Pseudovirgaria hyperparasitica]|uniref:SRR1-like domain-containing protein n=1 Tax=Pseudovirgaria hyperparasitica TaxID=470096 RepID=A0A6A6VWC7_9PEZI|nr:uncharacterized protein EJ05DRAFT_503835 [Pseudovirgaria hyperparasitica]KAF2754892.1 hypothetical protein EJ05DRAFT_503835 [Pseudovirgaria hyperparasitica]